MKIATLCYLKRDGKTLMMHRNKKKNDAHEGKWNGVGGKLDEGETPEECAVREVEEETGFKAKNPKLKGRLVFPAFDKQPEDWHVYVFEIDDFSGKLTESVEGEFKWIDDNKLLALNLWEGDKLFMGWMADNVYFSAKLVYNGDSLKEHAVVFHDFKTN